MRAALLVVLVSASAAADPPPFTIAIGASEVTSRFDDGGGHPFSFYDPNHVEFRRGQRGYLDIGWKLHGDLALDLHGALSTDSMSSSYQLPLTGTTPPSDYHFAPYELGVGATYEVGNRLWIAPWIGLVGVDVIHDYSYEVDAGPHLGFGGQLGVDLYESHRSRFAVLFHTTFSPGNPSMTQYGAGLAYRYF